jgi:hypothetical protein
MSKRHEKVGIKQGLRIEWLDYALNLRLAGVDFTNMRTELIDYMSNKLDNGEIGERGKTTTQIAVGMLMNIWGKCDSEINDLQKHALTMVNQQNALVCHWALLCAAYPFWYKVAIQTGRLLNLQDQTNKKQIIQRIKEQYGERTSVIRSAQRVIQGFIGVEVLAESQINRCYEKSKTIIISDQDLAILLYEAALYANPEGKSSLGVLKNDPAFFPFQLPVLTGDFIAHQSELIDVEHYGFGDELLQLRNQK